MTDLVGEFHGPVCAILNSGLPEIRVLCPQVADSPSKLKDATDRVVRPVMPELDTVRGVAILSVFLYHAFWVSYIGAGGPALKGVPALLVRATSVGWGGVNLFFILSGFLITNILLESKAKPQYFRRFYVRRALRILPAYVLLLALLLGTAGFLHRGQMAAFAGLSFLYLSNMTLLFGVPMLYSPLWSLAVEEHFYFLWPTVVRSLSERQIALVAGFTVAASTALRVYSVARGGLWWGPYTWLNADGLALGALLAVGLRGATSSRVLARRIAIAAAVSSAVAFLTGFFSPHAVQIALKGLSLNLGCLAIVSGVLLIGSGARRTWVLSPALRFFGYISYGLYLIHVLVLDLYDAVIRRFFSVDPVPTHGFAVVALRFMICAALATALSYLSRKTFEEYFLGMKDRLSMARPANRHLEAAAANAGTSTS